MNIVNEIFEEMEVDIIEEMIDYIFLLSLSKLQHHFQNKPELYTFTVYKSDTYCMNK